MVLICIIVGSDWPRSSPGCKVHLIETGESVMGGSWAGITWMVGPVRKPLYSRQRAGREPGVAADHCSFILGLHGQEPLFAATLRLLAGGSEWRNPPYDSYAQGLSWLNNSCNALFCPQTLTYWKFLAPTSLTFCDCLRPCSHHILHPVGKIL